MVADAITLSFPPARPFYGVARLVVGGLAARLDLTYEHLEDLQLALASVLEREEYAASGELTVELVVNPDSVGMVIGPLKEERVRADLTSGAGDGISLHRLLSTLVGSLELEQRDGGAWLRLEKRVPLRRPKDR